MAPKVPDDYREARRGQIIAAAAECFVEKGFHQTTMQDIFDRSGLSAGAVYNYFEGKNEIVTAMGKMSTARNVAMASMAPEADDHERLMKVFGSFLDVLKSADAGRWAPFDLDLYAEAARNDLIRDALTENLGTSTAVLVPLVEKLQASGAYPSDLDARSIVLAFFALIQSIHILRIVDPNLDLDAYAEVCTAIARGAFCRTTGTEPTTEEA